MSVNFWVKALGQGERIPHTPTSERHLDEFWDCDRMCYDWVDTGINISNANAHMVLNALGLVDGDEWWAGEVDGQDLKGRLLLASVTTDDNGFETTVTEFEAGATLIDCGVEAGYMAEKFALLMGLADQAISLDSIVLWG